MNMLKRYRFTCASAVLILVAFLMPGSAFKTVPRSLLELDKLAHLALFFIFTLSFQLEYRAERGQAPSFWFGASVVGVSTAGSELLQLATSTRSFDFVDMAYDVAGALVALASAAVITAAKNEGRGG